MTDTRDEVERIRAAVIAYENGYAVHVGCGGEVDVDHRQCQACGAHTDNFVWASGARQILVEWAPKALARIATLEAERDALATERLRTVARQGTISRLTAERDAARRERDALAVRLPSPAAVRAARVKAAEIVEAAIVEWREQAARGARYDDSRGHRKLANRLAAALRDLARMYHGTRDEGGDVDATTLAMIALDVDGLATLGELEEMARELREVE